MQAKNNSAKLICGVGIFAALAIIVSFATSFIKIQFLSLDAGDVIIVLASFIYGPLSSIIISAVSALVSFAYSGTGPWGMLMDFVSSAAFTFVASFIYSRRRSFASAIIGIYSAVLAVTIVMVPMNILVTPIYMEVPRKEVLEYIPTLLLPFNLFKALFNGGVALLIYKPLVMGLRSAKLIPPSHGKTKDTPSRPQKPWVSILIGSLSVIVAIAVLIYLDVKKG